MVSRGARPPAKPRAETRVRHETRDFSGVVVGWFAPGSTAAEPRVDFEGNPAGPALARSVALLDTALVERAVKSRQGVVLQFEGGKAERPIVVGLVQEPVSLLTELLAGGAREGAADGKPKGARRSKNEARLDGKRVVLEAENEIELRCGEASITLTRDGKIIVKGAYVETYSRGVNRIKGGAVKIN